MCYAVITCYICLHSRPSSHDNACPVRSHNTFMQTSSVILIFRLWLPDINSSIFSRLSSSIVSPRYPPRQQYHPQLPRQPFPPLRPSRRSSPSSFLPADLQVQAPVEAHCTAVPQHNCRAYNFPTRGNTNIRAVALVNCGRFLTAGGHLLVGRGGTKI